MMMMINCLLKKKHRAVRRLNYMYNVQVIVKMVLKNDNNKNVQIWEKRFTWDNLVLRKYTYLKKIYLHS